MISRLPLAAALLLLAAPSWAEPPASLEAQLAAGPSLSTLSSYALSANPSIRAARAGLGAAHGAARAAGWWPDPRLSYERSLDSDMWKATLAQGIPFPGSSGAASDAAEAAARAAEIDLAIAVRDQVKAVRESFWELAYLREAKRLAEGNRRLLAEVVSAGESGFARGRDALAEVLRARSQEAQAGYDVLLLGELAETEAARLNGLLDRPASAPIGPLALPSLPALALTPAEAERLAGERPGEALRAAEGVAEAEAVSRAAWYENLPMLELGGSYEKGGNRNLMASLSLPLWFGRNAGRAAAARAGLERARAEAARAGAETRTAVREAHFAARNSARLLALYRDTLLPQAARALESSQALYRQGTGGYSDMVEAAAAWNNFQTTAARARSDYGKALARLSALTGDPASPVEAGSALPPAPEAPAPALSLLPARGERLLEAPSPFQPALSPAEAAQGGTSLSPTFTLARLQATAFASAPAVLEADRASRAALSAYPQARELDDLLARYSAFSGEGKDAASLFPAPGPAALRGRIVDAEVKAAAARREAARRDAVTAAARAFWELSYNRAAQRVAAAEEGRASQLAASAAARYKAGGGPFAELAEAEGARKRAGAEAAATRAEQIPLEAKVREAVGLPGSSPVGAPEETSPPVDDPGLPELERLALARSPDLSERRAEVERMDLMVQMARREGYPGYSANLSLSDNRFLKGEGGEGPRAPEPFGAGAGPAWIRELDGRLGAAREGLRRAEAETASRVREAWWAFDRLRRESSLFTTDLVPLARLAADSALRSFEAGEGDLARVVRAMSAAAQADLARERRRSDLGIAHAELIAAAGGAWKTEKEIRP